MSNFNIVLRIIVLVIMLGVMIYEDMVFHNGNELKAIYDLSKLAFALSGWTWIDIKISKD